MLEVYVALTLLGIGVLLNKHTPKTIPSKKKIVGSNQKPSMQNVYSSKMTQKVQTQEAQQVQKHNTQIVKQLTNEKKIVSELTGEGMDLKHNNMFPFLRGSITQNMNMDANVSMMENFGTKNDTKLRKQEVTGMFVPEANLPFRGNNLDDLMLRVPKLTSQKNVLPFEQQRVGRGIDSGYNTAPTGGFHQTDIIDKILPKSVDELRVASKPKFGGVEGRVVEGQKGRNRGIAGVTEKRRPEKTFVQCHDRLIKTTGAILKEKQQPSVLPKDTSRMTTSAVSYSGGAFNKGKGTEQRGEVRNVHRQTLDAMQPANVKGSKGTTDYGKASVQIYTNERDITTTKTYKGNLQSLVKSIVTPIQDIIKMTKKEHFLDPTREFGELQAQFPSKITVYDNNDVARTTIKETTIQSSEKLNIKGALKLTVHDPSNIARTTIKETTIHDTESLNVKGVLKLTVYDPADIARTTARQTMTQEKENMNMASHVYKTVTFDPNVVARTTIKETLLQDTDPANMRKIEERGVMYKPDDKTRSTVRQTLDLVDTNYNMSTIQVHKGGVHDPDDLARVTIKETTIDANEDWRGIASGSVNKRDAAYIEAVDNIDVKGNQKTSYIDNDYFGGAQMGFGGDAYKDANFDAKITMKQDPSEYYGGANDQTLHFPMSQDDALAQTYNGLKESVLVERAPTNKGPSVSAVTTEYVNMNMKKQEVENKSQRLSSVIASNDERDIYFTKSKQSVNDLDRLDMEILEPFKKNPFTQPLNSAPNAVMHD